MTKLYTIIPIVILFLFLMYISNPSLPDKTSSSPPNLLPFCPTEPPTLLGHLTPTLTQPPPSLADISRSHPDLDFGGHYTPPNCTSRDKVAIILPFRDREDHLRTFLVNILPFLKRQRIEFTIFVIEQWSRNTTTDELPFNRAMLFNIGFVVSSKTGRHFDCFIFHDVDLIPENDYNLYNCPTQPRHLSVAVDETGYKLRYGSIFGGVTALTKQHFIQMNGFSNSFWGWGGEDDDMAGRVFYHNLIISRPDINIARYTTVRHPPQKVNPERYRLIEEGKTKFNSDGLNDLKDKYTVEQVVLENTYTFVRVQLFRSTR